MQKSNYTAVYRDKTQRKYDKKASLTRGLFTLPFGKIGGSLRGLCGGITPKIEIMALIKIGLRSESVNRAAVVSRFNGFRRRAFHAGIAVEEYRNRIRSAVNGDNGVNVIE